ncbi:uncharacterized protein LOC111077280 [Drosophila obscura]|uniref:uncharacterized protein LOC111077280 n=1 Tax=Drosophila obscura TaxID=7282 RepID=UPI001BB119D3|nr:uncharacterized protein LOC111077280 [Drosophila obscura]
MRLSFAVLICSLLIWKMCCEPKVIYKTTNLECSPNPKITANVSCILKAVNWNKAVAQMDMYLVEPVKNITIHLKIFKRDYSNKYHPFLVDVVVNLCDIIGRRNYSPYGKFIWGLFKRYTNVNHSCPFMGHIFARDFFVDESVVPMKLPLGHYLLALTPFENYREKPPQTLGSIKLYAQSMVPVMPRRNITKPTNKTNVVTTINIPIQNGN